MALWQYDFIVVPKNVSLELDSRIDEKTYNEKDFWNHKYEINSFKEFDKILPKGKSWSKNIILFGEENSNTLHVVIDDKNVIEVTLRIDFRTDYTALLNKILKFCDSNGFILLDENLYIMSYDLSKFIEVIENSRQFNIYKEMSQG